MDFIVNKNISKDKWKNYKINFNYIKRLKIFEREDADELSVKSEKFIENIISFHNFQINLAILEVYLSNYDNFVHSFNSSSFENLEKFNNLEILKLSDLHFA